MEKPPVKSPAKAGSGSAGAAGSADAAAGAGAEPAATKRKLEMSQEDFENVSMRLTPCASPAPAPCRRQPAALCARPLSPSQVYTAALRYSTIASRSPADSAVALPLAPCRHCFSSGQMALCEMP